MFVRRKDAERAEARRLRAEGWPLRKIALMCDVGIASVSAWVKDVQPPLPVDEKKRSEPRAETVVGFRRCPRCEQELPLSSFNRHRDGHQWWCRECFKQYFRQRGALHLRQSDAARKRRRHKARAFVAVYLATHPCADCGEIDTEVLEFDHLGAKRGDIGRLAWDGLALQQLRKEIAGCEVVCVNCHRRRTATRREWWRLDPARLDRDPRLLPGESRNLLFVRDTLLSSRCVDCGFDDIVALDFDHIGGKRGSVPELARRGCSLKRLKAEIARCVIRCANCHRRRTVAQHRATQGPK